jgi:hypothetical protein
MDKGQPASTTAPKSKPRLIRKLFSPLRLSKSAAGGTSTLAVSGSDTETTQDKLSSRPQPQGGTSQASKGGPTVEESVENSISRPIIELWDEAYDDLAKKDKDLVTDYEAELSKTLVWLVASSGALFSGLGKIQRRDQMKAVLENKIKEIEKDTWKLKFKNHELAVKDLVEPVVGIIDWAKDFVGDALEPSPYGSIAWAGVCVLLPVGAAFIPLYQVIPDFS